MMDKLYVLISATVIYLSLWAAGLVYLMPMKHRSHFPLRLMLTMIVGCMASLLFQFIYPAGDILVDFLFYYILMALMFLFCGNISVPGALYGSVWALVSQQMVLVLGLTAHYQLGISTGLFFGYWQWLGFLWFFALCYLALGLTIARWIPENGQYKIGPRQLSLTLLLIAIFELLFFMMFEDKKFIPDLANWETIILAQLYCVTVLYLESALFKKSAIKQELVILNRLWHQHKTQYSLAKENIAIINRKCHDLKHQMKAIRAMTNTAKQQRYLEEIKDSVQIYEAIANTGNEVLDTVLTEKNLYCEANKLSINCIADGSQLGFIDPIDLYTIFGNALDNAIESIQQLENEDERMIDVLVRAEQRFLVINIINPLNKKLRFEDDLPVSTKTNNGYHGFGLKSIRHTIKKYDGFLSVKVEDNCFALRILIPLPNYF